MCIGVYVLEGHTKKPRIGIMENLNARSEIKKEGANVRCAHLTPSSTHSVLDLLLYVHRTSSGCLLS